MSITLVVEDGTIVAGANSYISQADADTYLTNWYGASAWSDAVKAVDGTASAALYYGCYAMERLFGRKYLSICPPGSAQSLLWPRYTFVDNTFRLLGNATIPQCLKDAQCELAMMYLNGVSLFPNESDFRLLKSSQADLGELKTNNTYWQIPKDVEHYDGFRKVELILYPILKQENNNNASISL